MNVNRVCFRLFVLALCVFAGAASAQAPVRILSPFPPGGAVDTIARLYAERLSAALHRPVVVETKSGAAGRIAAEAVRTGAPDGSILMIAPDSMFTVYPHTVRKPVFDALNDFVALAHTGGYPVAFAIGAKVPAKTMKEYIEWARRDPKNASYGTAGAGTTLHFVGMMIAQAAGLEMTHVAYRGVGPALTNVVGGQIPATILPLGTVLQQAKAGKVRVLAHSGEARSSLAGEIPTLKELGFEKLVVHGWFGAFGPAGMPASMVSRYNEIFVQASRQPAVRERMRMLDLELLELDATQLKALIRTEYERWKVVVKASGFSADKQ